MVYELGAWCIERANEATLILNLATSDGFEVAFAVSAPQADHLGAALRACASISDAGIIN